MQLTQVMQAQAGLLAVHEVHADFVQAKHSW